MLFIPSTPTKSQIHFLTPLSRPSTSASLASQTLPAPVDDAIYDTIGKCKKWGMETSKEAFFLQSGEWRQGYEQRRAYQNSTLPRIPNFPMVSFIGRCLSPADAPTPPQRNASLLPLMPVILLL